MIVTFFIFKSFIIRLKKSWDLICSCFISDPSVLLQICNDRAWLESIFSKLEMTRAHLKGFSSSFSLLKWVWNNTVTRKWLGHRVTKIAEGGWLESLNQWVSDSFTTVFLFILKRNTNVDFDVKMRVWCPATSMGCDVPLKGPVGGTANVYRLISVAIVTQGRVGVSLFKSQWYGGIEWYNFVQINTVWIFNHSLVFLGHFVAYFQHQ